MREPRNLLEEISWRSRPGYIMGDRDYPAADKLRKHQADGHQQENCAGCKELKSKLEDSNGKQTHQWARRLTKQLRLAVWQD